MQQETTSWYKQEWFIVLSLLFIFPLGLFLMWKFSKWPSIARTIITVAISVIVLASITYYGNLQMIVPATSNSNNETKETTENNVNDKDERNHKTAVEETKTNYDSSKENTKEPGKENESATRLENSALEKAKSYYDDFHMSKLGIYDILTSEYGEKFDKEDAQYAIDHLEADYEKNALEKAKSYAKDMHMSNDSIYDLLVSNYGEKFTESEAKYAIEHLDN
ncbi:Ltp family lipoprotein [Staphylococcus epidermidis]|uniref:Ltp family lipoprotein n=1 Tax=Staphylococcus epidermidis TaxID=1282 RepID=UPI0019331467|nr:Ltp family lipoprotein [Staphylococcus epidermidis]MBM0807625.1 hypothetical protein [Staphylococcus epidermidis]